MQNIFRSCAVSAVLFGAAGSVGAAPISFDLTGGGRVNSSYSFSSNGVSVTVTASAFKDGFKGAFSAQQDQAGNTVNGYITSGNEYDSTALVGQWSNGLGVYSNNYQCFGTATCTYDDRHTVDGRGWDDFLIFSFSETVQLTSAEFSYFNSTQYQDDHFRIFYDLNGDGTLGDDDFITYRYNTSPFLDFPTISTNLIGIVATDTNDRWKLKALHGHAAPPPPPPSVVPLPAGGLLLLSGIGAFGLMRRRARKAGI